ncbi:MAG: type II restriction endonuclease [Egibacteraceae bacterium]
MDLREWLRDTFTMFEFDVSAVYRRGAAHEWPLVGLDAEDLEQKLAAGGHLLPLPKEPAALANIIEVRIVDFVLSRVDALEGAEASRGVERGYPDVEIGGEVFGGGYHAVDVKVARLNARGSATQSRVTLYTGNTYFRYPQLRWPGTFRPFRDYATHLDIVAAYRFTPEERQRLTDLELMVHESWRIGSRQRSSTTREYIGGVQSLRALREGLGEFASEEEFYRFWRRYPFRIGAAVQRQLDRLLESQDERSGGVPDQ